MPGAIVNVCPAGTRRSPVTMMVPYQSVVLMSVPPRYWMSMKLIWRVVSLTCPCGSRTLARMV